MEIEIEEQEQPDGSKIVRGVSGKKILCSGRLRGNEFTFDYGEDKECVERVKEYLKSKQL